MKAKVISLGSWKFPFSQEDVLRTTIAVRDGKIYWNVPSDIRLRWPKQLVVTNLKTVGLFVSANDADFRQYHEFLRKKRPRKEIHGTVAPFTDFVTLSPIKTGFILRTSRGNQALKSLLDFEYIAEKGVSPSVKVIDGRYYLFVPTKETLDHMLKG